MTGQGTGDWRDAFGRYPRFWRRRLTRPDVVELHGIQLAIGPKVSREVRHQIYSERYERGEVRCLLAHLEPDDVVLEAGAGMGLLSALAARRIGSERVFTYEADPELLPVIADTHRRNGVAPTVTHGMLGDGDGEETFYLEPDLVSSSTHARSAAARAVQVPRLDVGSELRRVRPTLMVMDIEGGERELVPLIDWGTIRKLVVELHPKVLGEGGLASVVARIEGAGFVLDRRVSSTRKRYFARASAAGFAAE